MSSGLYNQVSDLSKRKRPRIYEEEKVKMVFTVEQIFKVQSFTGLACACCDEPQNTTCTCMDSKIVFFCPYCQAILCNTCAISTHMVRCSWCSYEIYSPLCKAFSITEQDEWGYQMYNVANKNLLKSHGWFVEMHSSHPNFQFSDIFWANIVTNMGWRFFLYSNFLLRDQHPIQYNMLLTMMKLNTERKILPCVQFQNFRRSLHDSISSFKAMDDRQQFVYQKARGLMIMHRFAIHLIGHFKCPKLSFLMRFVLSKYEKKLLLGLGICKIFHTDFETSDEYISHQD